MTPAGFASAIEAARRTACRQAVAEMTANPEPADDLTAGEPGCRHEMDLDDELLDVREAVRQDARRRPAENSAGDRLSCEGALIGGVQIG